jgi:uracil-DNA glycosylase
VEILGIYWNSLRKKWRDEMKRVVLIGQAPGPNTNPEAPLFPAPRTSAGGRLMEFLGLSTGEYLERFDRYNLLQKFPGKDAGGEDKFSMRQARLCAGAIKPFLHKRCVVFVGRAVAEAFGYPKCRLEFFEWAAHRPVHGSNQHFVCSAIPHPSGRNHFYNDPENKLKLKTFFEQSLRHAAEAK